MSAKSPPPTPDLAELTPSWVLTLRAQRKSKATIEQYEIAVRLFVRWCEANGHTPVIDRQLVQRFVADIMEGGVAPSTATLRLSALKQFTRWLIEEGELDDNPLLGVKAPKVDVKMVDALTDDELRLLLRACSGKEFRDRRDEMVVRLLVETGMRAGEVLGLTVEDLDPGRGLVMIHKTKTGRGRYAPFSPQTGEAVDRYLRMRRKHKLGHTPTFLLGDNNRGTIAYHGLRDAIMDRAEAAGIKNFRLHRLRHTAATRWLSRGGSEGGAMAVMGWQSPQMLHRYVAATASERAVAEARTLGLGDL
ncbi:tyrosine-type recombinase/integrase [Mycobacterium sp. G7A2]|uniref:tyrosine-type recombinase/integrase n=1 Tax=Mycobacterium sp. G7A2 TaxID=3317307 RepID=UPI0035A99482